jgi:MFS family permease
MMRPASFQSLRADPLLAYLVGLGGWFISFAIAMVLVPWLVLDVLHQSADRLGIVQMSSMVPLLLFLLWGGVAADRGDRRRQVLLWQLLAALPPAGLALLDLWGQLSFWAIVAYGLAVGTASAFAVPAREGLLPHITQIALPRAVALAVGVQFACQLAGIALATVADAVGAIPLLSLQAVAMLVGGFAVWLLPEQPGPARVASRSGGLDAFWKGIDVAWQSPQILPVLLLILGVGLFYVATFFVVLPIMVRDIYGGGSARLATVTFVLWSGMIVASIGMMRLGDRIKYRGRAVLLSVSGGVIVLFALATMPDYEYFLAFVFCWGLSQGVTMTQGRTIVQVAAPSAYLSHLLAMFQLCYLGGTPLGAPILGRVTDVWGSSTALWLAGAGMIGIIALVAALSTIWRQELTPAEA